MTWRRFGWREVRCWFGWGEEAWCLRLRRGVGRGWGDRWPGRLCRGGVGWCGQVRWFGWWSGMRHPEWRQGWFGWVWWFDRWCGAGWGGERWPAQWARWLVSEARLVERRLGVGAGRLAQLFVAGGWPAWRFVDGCVLARPLVGQWRWWRRLLGVGLRWREPATWKWRDRSRFEQGLARRLGGSVAERRRAAWFGQWHRLLEWWFGQRCRLVLVWLGQRCWLVEV